MSKVSKYCLKCGKVLTWTGRHKRRKYCSFVCSNSHHNYVEMWIKSRLVSHTSPGNPGKRDEKEINRLRTIGAKGGIARAKIQVRRSKGEILLSELFSKNGFKLKTNVWNIVKGYEIDIFLPDYNLAISYNGPVHRTPIYGVIRLQQVLRRDSYRDRKLSEMGIRHIVVEDEGHFSVKKVNKQYLWCLEKINDAVSV